MINIIPIQNDEHWHILRSQTVGSSEVAALFDASPFLTRFELWHRKKGNIPAHINDNERMFWGRKLEQAIAEGVAEQHGWEIKRPDGYYLHPTVEGFGCTPDFIINDPVRGLGIMEIKNVDFIEFRDKWLNEEPPLYYILQLQSQLACTGFSWGCIAALVAGNTRKLFFYDLHCPTISKIETAVQEFWGSIEDNQEPAAVCEDYDVARKLHSNPQDREIDLSEDNYLPSLCAAALEAQKQRIEAEKAEKAAKAEIMRKVGDATAARCNGFYLKFPVINKQMPAKEAHTQSYRQLTIKEISA